MKTEIRKIKQSDRNGMGIGMYIWFIIAFIIFFFGIMNFVLGDEGKVYKKCYDRFSNEIIGEKCIEQRLVEPNYFINNFLLVLFLINLFCNPLILILIQNYLNKRQREGKNYIK